jgi:hypothetical protein
VRPAQHLRLWLRAGPAAERVVACVALLVAVSITCWVAVPRLGSTGARDVALSGSATAGTTTSSKIGTTGTTVTVGRTPTAAGPALPASSRTATGPLAPGGTQATSTGVGRGPITSTTHCPAAVAGQGVSATEIRVGVALVTLGALNSAIGIPTSEEHRRAYNAVFGDVNKHGGVLCRKLVPVFYDDNVIDSGSERAVCLQMQQDKVFAVLNNLFNNENLTCVAQAHIPNFWYTAPLTSQARKYAPYIISYLPDYTRLIKQYVRGAQAVGWFAGVKRIGILEDSCRPENNTVVERELTAAGYPKAMWSIYNYGCTSSGTGQEPDKDTSAAVQFRGDGVTHVLSVAYDKAPGFAKAAEQQRYQPKYAEMSDGGIESQDHTTPAQSKTFDGTLDITSDQIGAENTPGIRFSPATARCRALIKGAGLPDPVDPNAGTAGPLYGAACVQTAMLVQALLHAPSLARASLAAGLVSAGQLDLSYPAGPGKVADTALPMAGNFWRTEAYRASCNCWQVTSPTWRRQFT